jgi:hypothetical protein
MRQCVALICLCLMAVFGLESVALAQPAANGTITANGGRVVFTVPEQRGRLALEIQGTWTGTVTFRASVSCVAANFTARVMTPIDQTAAVSTTTGNGKWEAPANGYRCYEAIATAAWTGTATIYWNATN